MDIVATRRTSWSAEADSEGHGRRRGELTPRSAEADAAATLDLRRRSTGELLALQRRILEELESRHRRSGDRPEPPARTPTQRRKRAKGPPDDESDRPPPGFPTARADRQPGDSPHKLRRVPLAGGGEPRPRAGGALPVAARVAGGCAAAVAEDPGAPAPPPAAPRPPACSGAAGSAAGAQQQGGRAACMLPGLPTQLAAKALGYLHFLETMRSRAVARGADEALAHAAAWDPLVLGRAECGVLLRHVKVCFSLRSAQRRDLPAGVYKVLELRVNLMSCETMNGMDFDETVFDPFGELCNWLQRSWGLPVQRRCGPGAYLRPLSPRALLAGPQGPPTVWTPRPDPPLRVLQVSNIEDQHMDHRFLDIRASMLGSFPTVRVDLQYHSQGFVRNVYSLRADRGLPTATDPGAGAFPAPDMAVAATSNSRRREACLASFAQRPFALRRMETAAEPVDEAEALFLQEYTQAFKSGENFVLQHNPASVFSGRHVRKRYQELLDRARRHPAASASASSPRARGPDEAPAR